MSIKPVAIALYLFFACASLPAQTVWQPSPGHTQIALWPGTPPDLQKVDGPEKLETDNAPKELVAGKPWLYISNVTRSTITVYSPKVHNTGAAVVVFPGGGYEILAIDLEGTEVCDWLVQKGITCVLLKYRVPAPRKTKYWGAYPESPIALEDAQRAIGLVRLHAAEWHIDPHKLGVLGFSAGGYLVAQISTNFAKPLYAPIDDADKQSSRPDFSVAVYPGHLSTKDNQLNPNVPVSKETPPTFIVQAEDDHVDGVEQALVYFRALSDAQVPVEMHLYAEGGHAFGLRPTRQPITHWPVLVEDWLRTIHVIQ